jgi:hypothetical protein
VILAARGLSVLALALLLVLAALVVRYQSVRAAWGIHGAAIDTAAYDAGASDAAYAEVESALTWVERAARAGAVLVVAAGLAIGRAQRTEQATVARRRIARLVDAGSIALVLLPGAVTWSSPGIAVAWTWVAPALVVAVLVAFAASGATLGDRVAR